MKTVGGSETGRASMIEDSVVVRCSCGEEQEIPWGQCARMLPEIGWMEVCESKKFVGWRCPKCAG